MRSWLSANHLAADAIKPPRRGGYMLKALGGYAARVLGYVPTGGDFFSGSRGAVSVGVIQQSANGGSIVGIPVTRAEKG